MRLLDKIDTKPSFKTRDINSWADYIEFVCLNSQDHFVTQDDILDIILDDEVLRGEEEHSVQYDKILAEIESYFDMIAFREKTATDFYPFSLEEGAIYLRNINDERVQYIFLLICSNLKYFESSSWHKYTDMFEVYSKYFFKYMVPRDAEVNIFGTSRRNSIFSGNLRTRIKQLANCIGGNTTKSFDNDNQFDVPGGDEGLDLVAYLKLDGATHIPIAFGQCTCSHEDWDIKQESINQENWNRKIEGLAPYTRFMFVPFYCRLANGQFENPTTISTCLIDIVF